MTETKLRVVMVRTSEGVCPVHLHALLEGRPVPGLLLLMDAPGNLADDTPTNPHLLANSIQARVCVAGATDDANSLAAQKALLEQSLAAAGVEHSVETYPARHGWVPSDMPGHDPGEADHHWRTLLPLLSRTLP